MRKFLKIETGTGLIKYFQDQILVTEFILDEIIGIGELVTDRGPLNDDHFLTFISSNRIWHSISSESEGFDQLITFVGSKLNITSLIQLANVTHFKSRMIYPKDLNGKEFMTVKSTEPTNWLEKIKISLGLKNRWEYVVTSEISEALNLS